MPNFDQTAAPDSLQVPIEEIVAVALEYKASDIHFKAGQPPVFRIDGQLTTFPGLPAFSAENLSAALMGLLNRRQHKMFEENMELDAALVIPGKARVRLNIYTDVEAIGC